MTEQGRGLSAEKTGLWVVAVYEKTGSLLAVHGPYPDASTARDQESRVQPGDRAESYPLWHPDHVGRE